MISTTPEGSFDKGVLEAMACGLPVVTTNPFLQALVAPVSIQLVPTDDSVRAVAAACRAVFDFDDDCRRKVGAALREVALEQHALESFADRLIAILTASSPFEPATLGGKTQDSPPVRDFRVVASELWRGSSILKAQAHAAMKQRLRNMSGLVVELACGVKPTYRRVLGDSIQYLGLDRTPRVHPHIVADFNSPLPLRSGIADGVVLAWALYIAAEPIAVLSEAARVLRPGGRLVLTTPLMFPHTPEPADYWRFTDEGLRLMLRRAGFEDIEVIPLGERWSSSAYLLTPYLRPSRVVGFISGLVANALDRGARRLPRRTRPCPTGYLSLARRPLRCESGRHAELKP